jgi:DUF1680 family protein
MHSQRANGGFGTDTCLSDAERDIYMLCYDASWCCTMRGGDGLASAVEYNYFYDNDGFYLPFYNNSNVALKFDDGQVHIIQKTQYPCDGNVQLEVVSSSLKSEKNVCFYIPSWVKSDALKVTLNDIAIPFKREHLSLNFRYFPKAGDLIIISFEISLMQQETINAKHGDSFITLRHGSLILGQKKSLNEEINPNDEFVYQGYGRYISKSSGIVIRPIGDIDDPTAENKGFKALFKR